MYDSVKLEELTIIGIFRIHGGNFKELEYVHFSMGKGRNQVFYRFYFGEDKKTGSTKTELIDILSKIKIDYNQFMIAISFWEDCYNSFEHLPISEYLGIRFLTPTKKGEMSFKLTRGQNSTSYRTVTKDGSYVLETKVPILKYFYYWAISSFSSKKARMKKILEIINEENDFQKLTPEDFNIAWYFWLQCYSLKKH